MKEEAKPTGKTYEIDSLEKLVNVVNSENYERISIDVLLWLKGVTDLAELLRKELPDETKGKSNFEILRPSFTWVDDGKNEHLSTKITNVETGEVHQFTYKNNETV